MFFCIGQAFVTRLQASADHLASENRALRKMHQRMGEEVVALMGIDLLRQREVSRVYTRSQPIRLGYTVSF